MTTNPEPSDRAGLSEAERDALILAVPDELNPGPMLRVVGRILADRLAVAEQERDEARAKVRDYERGITWDTTCTSCAKAVEQLHAAEQEAATLRTQVAAVEALADEWRSGRVRAPSVGNVGVALRVALGASVQDGEPTFGALADGEPGYEIDTCDVERDGEPS